MGLTVLLMALSVTFTESSMTQNYDRNLVEEVRIENNHRIPADSIKYRIQTKAGDRFDLRIIDADIRRIYALDQFDDIRVSYEEGKTGRIIIFWVKEKKAVRSVQYEGLKSITSSEIVEKLKEKNTSISPETPYDPRKIKRAESIIASLLSEKGHEDAHVTSSTEDVPTNAVVVTFKVDEGPKVRVQKITIQGNKVFSAGEIKGAMKLVKESNPVTSILGRDTYFDLKLADDITRIRLLYAQHGYVRVNIADPVVETRPHEVRKRFPPFPLGIPLPSTRTLRRYFITIKIDEGSQYRVGQVNISGNKQFDEAKVRTTLGLVPGEIFNEVKIRENFLELKKMYGARGYINFTAIPVQTFDESKKLLNLSINIDEDRQFYVHRIAFSGNTTTRDRVIRREIMLDEGQLFNSTLWDQSIQRLNQLGYFEPLQPQDAQITPSQTAPEVDIRLKVKEKDRNLLGLTGGVSGIGGSFVGLNYQSNNFLGLGDTFGLTLQGGTRQSEYRLSFTQPYLFNRPLTAGFSAYATKFVFDQSQSLFGVTTPLPSGLGLTDQLNFTQKTEGIDLYGSYPIKVWQRAGLTFGINHSQTSAINPATADYFGAVKTQTDQDLASSQTGTNFSNFHGHSLTPSFTVNRTKGSVFNPIQGFSMSTTLEYTGGFLGGTVNYYRPSLDFRYFHPVNKGRNTIAFRILTSYVHGYGGVAVPYYQRLFLGGDFDIRGFDFREITPIAFITHNVTTTDASGNSVTALADDVVYVGGDTQAVMNLEYRIPIVSQIVTLAPFFDAGNAWVWDKAQLTRHILNPATGQLDTVPVQFLPGTNSGIRTSTGLELQIMLPVIRAPFRIIYAQNPNRINNTFVGPTFGTPFSINQKAHDFKFTIGRTF